MERKNGFTLIELVIVLAVAAILMVLGVPALQDMVRNNRLVTETNNLVAHLNLARSEAIKRRARVALCGSADPAADVPTCAGSQDWDTGWIAFVDANANGAPDSTDDVLRRGAPVAGAMDVRVSAVTIAYATDGTAAGGAAVTFAVCDERAEQRGRQIFVAGTGRPQVSGPPIADCTP